MVSCSIANRWLMSSRKVPYPVRSRNGLPVAMERKLALRKSAALRECYLDGASQAILMCGTGIGVAITANKVPGVRAAVCHDMYSAQRARKSNDCQIMALGARVVGEELAKTLVDTWLDSSFEGGKSAEKVERIKEIEGHYAKR